MIKNNFKAILIAGLMIMTSLTQANSFFGVDLDLAGVGVEVRVNDIPIYFDRKAGALTVELPCPDAIIDGSNSLSVFARLPKKGKEFLEEYEPGAYVSARLFRQENDGKKQYLTALKLQVNAEGLMTPVKDATDSKSEPILLDLGGRAASFITFVEISSPFPKWMWQSGETIEDSQENFDSLVDAYQKVHRALSANDQELLKQLYFRRAQEIAQAYNLSGVEAGHEKISTGEDAKNPKLELLDFINKNNLMLEVVANGKLAKIVTKSGTGNQPIAYMQENPRLIHIHKYMFYKNEKNQWVMIR